jgi:hypothetical protein
MPFIVYAEYDESKVTVQSVRKDSTEGYGKEVNGPRVSGKDINLDIQFTYLDDSITYNLVIKNESGEDIELYNKLVESNHVEYMLIAPDLDYVVKNGSSKTFQLHIEYTHQVAESEADEGVFYDDKVYSLEVSNELGRVDSALGIDDVTHDAVDPTPTSTNVPDTVDNPKTLSVKNILTIVCIVFVISIGLFLILRRKNRIGKLFVIVGLIGIIIPIVVYAYKDFKINFNTKVTILVGIEEVEEVEEPVEIEITDGRKFCLAARTLHTETCTATSDSTGQTSCAGTNMSNQDITFGKLHVSGQPYKVGEAFDCDINGDYTYDPVTERFYVLKSDASAEIVTLIYYSNYGHNGPVKLHSEGVVPYHAGNATVLGPATAAGFLPRKNVWLIGSTLNTRDIYNSNGDKILTFDYGSYAARFPSYSEIRSACPIGDDVSVGSLSSNNQCNFLLENTNYINNQYAYGYWLETPSTDLYSNVWTVNGSKMSLAKNRAANTTDIGVRPVIEINYTRMG